MRNFNRSDSKEEQISGSSLGKHHELTVRRRRRCARPLRHCGFAFPRMSFRWDHPTADTLSQAPRRTPRAKYVIVGPFLLLRTQPCPALSPERCRAAGARTASYRPCGGVVGDRLRPYSSKSQPLPGTRGSWPDAHLKEKIRSHSTGRGGRRGSERTETRWLDKTHLTSHRRQPAVLLSRQNTAGKLFGTEGGTKPHPPTQKAI